MAPSKNRINMHDIVAQPLGDVADAIDAVIRRPETLDEIELRSLFAETSYIFLRVEEAYAMNDPEAASALLQLLLEGFTAKVENALAIGWTTFATDDALLSSLKSIFTLVFLDEVVSPHSPGAANLAQLICTLSEGEALKEACGEMFIVGLIGVLQRLYDRPSEANAYFQIQRSVAAALINLMKGSRENKARVADWNFLLPCLTMSTDFFFQLQCVELLYRVSRKNRRLLKDLTRQQEGRHTRNEKLIAVLKSLDQLTSDEKLLARMLELVKSMNADRSDIVPLSALKVMAGETLLTSNTQTFFTPHYMVVLVASASADNVTIPYRSIRSVTIAKDGTVMFRLEAFPPNIEPAMSKVGAGMDTVSIGLNTEQLGALKASPVRGWIITVLQLKARERAEEQADANNDSAAQGVGVPGASSPTPGSSGALLNAGIDEPGHDLGYPSAMSANRKRTMDNRTMTPPLGHSGNNSSGSSNHHNHNSSTESESDKAKASATKNISTRTTAAGGPVGPSGSPAGSVSLNDITVSDPSTTTEAAECRVKPLELKRLRTEPAAPDAPGTGFTGAERGAVRPPPHEPSNKATPSLSSSLSSRLTGSDADSALSTLLRTLTDRMPRKDRHAFLSQMERLAEAKRSLRVTADVERINGVIASIQASLGAVCERCAKHREEWQKEVMRGVEQLDVALSRSEEVASLAVEKLNEGLRQVKASNQALEQRIACMRLRLQETLEKSILAEDAAKETLLLECEAELERQECEMDAKEAAHQQQAWRPTEAVKRAAAQIAAPPHSGDNGDGGGTLPHYSVGSLLSSLSSSSVPRRGASQQ